MLLGGFPPCFSPILSPWQRNHKLQYELDANDDDRDLSLARTFQQMWLWHGHLETGSVSTYAKGMHKVCASGDWGGTVHLIHSYTHKLHSYAGRTLSFSSQIFSVPFVNIVPLIQYSGIMIIVHVLHLLVLRRDWKCIFWYVFSLWVLHELYFKIDVTMA